MFRSGIITPCWQTILMSNVMKERVRSVRIVFRKSSGLGRITTFLKPLAIVLRNNNIFIEIIKHKA